ncbi:MAG TPA: hypothetical protein VNJ71_02060 [Gemmatimonadales bacterium]|jgi:hypothetical protein|nr:hypothetical protein [Gemmatimonadales bacterium]
MAIRVFVNERPCTLPAGARVRDALEAFDPALAAECAAGAAIVTDGRGLAIGLDQPLQAGAILRARRSSRQAGRATTDGRA